ncbi:MAG TPA: carboxypeptidase regulatory-like domain-containing protein, partial [Polyangia bacterium]
AGLVLDPEGRPAGGAIVSLSRGRARRSESVQPVSPAKADEGGRFQFESVPRGTYRATASVVGFKAASSAPFEVAANQRAEITLRLERGGHTLSGRVLDAGGGAIPNARVSARLGFPWSLIVDPKSPPRLFEAVADADGRYSFTLDAREYEVRVFADGYAHFDTTVALNRSVVRDLVLQPAARIYGTLFEAGTRNLVAGATVSLLNQDSRNIGAGVRDVQSDEEGRFGFNEVPLGSYQVFARDSRRNLIGNGPVVTAIPFKTAKPIEVALATGSAVQGSAVDESGKPVAGAIVDLRSGLGEAPTVRNVLTSITDAAGHFFLGGLLPGRHQVTVSSGDTVATQDVAVEADKTARLALTLRPRPSQLAVAGRVFKADGQPAGAVMVRLERAGSAVLITTETDDLGNYRLSGGGEGEGTVCAWHPTLGVGKVAVRGSAQGNSSVDVRLSPGLSIGGVVHFVDGAPAEAISVAVTRQEAGVFYDSTTTDDRGRFLIQSLLPGTYTVSATRKRGPHNVSTYQQRPELKIIRLVDGETKADVALVVRRGGKSIRGVVTRDDGQPAVGAHVIA